MSESDKHHPDKTPIFGLDDLEGPGRTFDETAGYGIADTSEPEPVERVGPSIVLHDKLSGVRVVTDKFPVEIGNGRRFNMALRGPGPDGLYARIEQDDGGLAIECCHQRVFMAVDMVEEPRHRLIGPASIQLGDHLISFDFSDQAPVKPRRKRPKWAILLVVALMVLGTFLLRWLLVADEAESRVTVVPPENQQEQVSPVDASPVSDDKERVMASGVTSPEYTDPEEAQPTEKQVEEAPQDKSHSEGFHPAPLAVFFSISRALPVASESQPTNVATEPTVGKKAEPATPKPEARSSAVKSAPSPIVQRYQRGEPIMVTGAPPALKQALGAIRDFYDSEILVTQINAWDNLIAAEQQLGLDQPSARREQIRVALGDTLLKAAAEQARLDNDREAYAFYYRAEQLGRGNASGSQLMAALDDKAARLYRFGYRLKYANPTTAGQYWTQVMEKVPSQSEWYRKAELALNETKGVRG